MKVFFWRGFLGLRTDREGGALGACIKSCRGGFFALRTLFALALALCFFSCGAPAKDGLAFTLKNGVPVYYKSVDSTKMASVIICAKGGVMTYSREMSGIDSALFDLMSRGSEKYSYDKIRRLAYDSSVSIGSRSTFAGSVFTLSCLSSCIDEALEVFLDCFLNPAFDQVQYDNMMTEVDQGLQRLQNDPQSLLTYTIGKELYKGHPLQTSASVLPESRSNITLENIKKRRQEILDAKRIFVVAAGDISLSKLRRALGKTLAKIPAKEKDFSIPPVPELDVNGPAVSLKSPALANGSGHIAIVFKSPAHNSPDLIAARIAASMYGESLFNIVRTKHGACYTPSTAVGFSPAPYGMVFLYRVSDMKNAASYIPEAEEDFLQSDIEGKLKGYVKKYMNSAWQNQMTCSSIASRAATALLTFGQIDGFDKLAAAASDVSAQDVRRVFRDYWQSGKNRLFAISGE
jgi:zinc protease